MTANRIRFTSLPPVRMACRLFGGLSVAAGLFIVATPSVGAFGAVHYQGKFSAAEPTGFIVSPDSTTLPAGGSVDVTFSTEVTNITSASQTAPLYFSIWHVLKCNTSALQAKCGGGALPIDVSSGAAGSLDPVTFDLHENWKTTEQQIAYPAGTSTVPTASCSDPGASSLPACLLTLAAHEKTVVTFVGRVTKAGYYQVDLGNSRWACGTATTAPTNCVLSTSFSALSASLIRVLPDREVSTPTPSPSPSPSAVVTTPTPTPTPTATPTPAPTPVSGVLGIATSGGGSGSTAAAPTPDTGAADSISGGSIALLTGGMSLLIATRRRRR